MTRTRNRLVSCGLGLLGVGLALGASAVAVGAAESTSASTSLSFPLDTVVSGEPGTIHEITSSDVPANMVGQSCTVTATADNNGSVHPQSNLIVASGTDPVTVRDIEATAGVSTTAEGTLTLGPTITVSVQLGPDGVFSGGGSVDLVCTPVPVTVPTTKPVPPTTPPPVEDITVARPAAVEAAVVTAPALTG